MTIIIDVLGGTDHIFVDYLFHLIDLLDMTGGFVMILTFVLLVIVLY